MSPRPEVWLAVEPTHLPHYGHTAGIVGTVIILGIVALVAAATWLHRDR
ncbi:hypothetical protein [Mycobacterium sp.]|nr:hypothetical protein [Mycobacterium sp.]